MERLKARGSQGSWFARIGDEEVPCAWKRRLKHWPHYHDPEAKPDQIKWQKYIEAIERNKKVALTDEREDENGKWHRQGYIALFEVDNVQCGKNGLEFDIVNKLAQLE